jgi:hypothetical protein
MSASEATTIAGVACFGASEEEAATVATFLEGLTDEQRAVVIAIHFCTEDGYLPALGGPMPNPGEWGGAWANPGEPGKIVLRPARASMSGLAFADADLPRALAHELAHLLGNVRHGYIDHGDTWRETVTGELGYEVLR